VVLAQEHLEAIIVATIAVGGYGIEKSYALLPEFRKLGLTDPVKISNIDIVEVIKLLNSAGYHRGLLAEMMSERLICLMKAVAEGKLDDLNSLIKMGEKADACRLLCQLKGIGPKVAANVWMMVRT
jgi:endonuclease III-like uncharacterized protein